MEGDGSGHLTGARVVCARYAVTLDPATGTLASVKNLASGVTAQVALDIGFYNASLGGCTPGVGSWGAQKSLRTAPNTKLSAAAAAKGGKKTRRETFETGMDPLRTLRPDAGEGAAYDDDFACDDQASGAYIFRPNSSYVFPAACSSDFAGTNDCSAPPTFQVLAFFFAI